jgi:iturin family lipopeptide synthetase A
MIAKENAKIRTGMEIAVIGMSGRFPGAKNLHEFWDNLKNGVESIAFFSEEELLEAGIDEKILEDSNYLKAYGHLQDKELFEASFFGYSPPEAELMNPQIRIFHECVWEALEDAGYNAGTYNERIGIYAGAAPGFHWEARSHLSGKSTEYGGYAAAQLIGVDYLCSRVSYNLNLKGGTSFVQTACSTSLVAIHQASRALLTGESEMALAGGTSLLAVPKQGYLYREGMIFSRDGHCRTFAGNASGTIGGEGAGVVLLKRLKSALRDRDHIYAIIRGSAINNDGKRKVGFTAPSIEAQSEVIRTARRMARVEPETITYIEAHGTATNLGDPVEIEALKLAFNTGKRGYCGIGSVKSNFGHLDAAAGAAGFIKTVLALKHKLIPPSLHFETPNPAIDFENSPFYVNTTLKKWQGNGSPLQAGVSSFGIGGTNAHIILEEWPDAQGAGREAQGEESMVYDAQDGRGGSPCPPSNSQRHQLILLSARTPTALEKMTENLARYIKQEPGLTLADAAYTLQVGRETFPHRRKLVCSTMEQTIAALTSPGTGKSQTYHWKPGEQERDVIFMFPGQGAQYVEMGLELYQSETIFREEMDRCFEILKSHLEIDIKAILYPHLDSRGGSPCPPEDCVGSPGKGHHRESSLQSDRINQTEVAQPLLFAFENALAKLLMKWGIRPQAMIGHSIGELVAAHLSGVYTLEDGLKLAALRGRLMQQMPPGAMVSVPIPEERLIPLLSRDLSLAAVNGPSLCVVSGPDPAIESFEKQMEEQGVDTRKLQTSHAFHSTMMEPVLEEFKKEVARVTLNKPEIPYISGVSGNWITAGEVMDPGYWARHVRETVRFSQGLEKLLNKKNSLYLEVGPGNVLSTLLKRHNQHQPAQRSVHFVRHPREKESDRHFFLNKIGELWLYGKSIDWSEFYRRQERRRVSLPTYPFEGQPYWIEKVSVQQATGLLAGKALLKKKQDTRDWYYIPLWKQSSPGYFKGVEIELPAQSQWLVFTDELGVGTGLKEKLQQKEQRVISVKPGTEFARVNDLEYIIHPGQEEHYISLFTRLQGEGEIPGNILHLWNVTGSGSGNNSLETVKKELDHGYFSLLYQARALGKLNVSREIQIMVVTDNVQEVTGEEELSPGKAAVLGPAKVIPQEYRNISCRCIDIPCPRAGNGREPAIINRLLKEIRTPSNDTVVAFRGSHRWVQIYEHLPLENIQKERETNGQLRQKGVYLVTGGLGRIGMVMARYLAATVEARLVLVDRYTFPAREEWRQWVYTHKNDSISQKIEGIQELEKMGAKVIVMQADVADPGQMHRVIHQAEETFAPINGVIHAAGLIGEKALQAVSETGQSHSREQFHAKVHGVLVLEKVLENKPLDFCLLFSSLASVLGGLGFTAYSAANIFMDYFARHHNRSGAACWTTINWDGWDFRTNEENPAAAGKNTDDFSILPREGIKAFENIFLLNRLTQIVVSSGDLQTRIDRWLAFGTEDEEIGDREEESSPGQGREHLSTTYVAPANPVQQEIIATWEKFFGIKPIGISDDFFQLGGDSLTAVTMARKLHKKLNVVVPLAEFFNRPTVKDLAEYIHQAERNAYSSITSAREKQYYELSSAQRRLYVLQQMDLTSTAYNQYHVGLLEGELDRERFTGAFETLIQRHEILRSSIFMVKDRAVQQVHHEVEFAIEYDDTGNRQEITGNEGELRPETVMGDFVRPFDLSRPPYMRVRVIKPGEQKHILLLDMHHLVTDGVSFGILIKELNALYGGRDLPPLKLQYKDYAEWQNLHKQQEFIKKQEEYWLSRYPDEIPVLHLAADHPRPAVQAFEGSSITFELDHRAKENLKKLGQEHDATLFMVTLAVFNILLAKLSGQEDIVVGSPVAGRTHADLQYIMGVFVNTLTLRNKPNGEKTFRAFLKEVKENAIKAFENQEYPFEDLVDNLAVSRDISRNPLFDVMFVLQNVEIEAGMIPEAQITGLKWKFLERERKDAKFDITLTAVEMRDRLSYDLGYSTALFKKETIERYIAYFKQLVTAVSENPGKNIAELDMVPAKERQQVLETFNSGPQVQYPMDKTIHRLYQEQVDKTPDQVALVGQSAGRRAQSEDERRYAPYAVRCALSYKELDRQANRLACLLRDRGVGRDTIVGVMTGRSIEMMVGIYAVLKAGGAYLPIDPDNPRERINYILADSASEILVAARDDTNEIKPGKEIIYISDAVNGASTPPHPDPSFDPAASLAYVIYTSGSTGKPKGVMIRHRSVINRLNWMQRYYPIGRGDVILQKTPYTFDVSVWELFWWGFQGASLCLLGPGQEKNPQAIIEAIEKNKVTTMHFVPSMLNSFLEYLQNSTDGEIDRLTALEQVFASGEALTPHQVETFERLLNKHNKTALINLYGPTEATVDVSYFNCFEEANRDKTRGIPIGKPIDNIRLSIVDKYSHPQPLGIPGELCISGDGLARGYLNRPELTAEKFDRDLWDYLDYHDEDHRSNRSSRSYRSKKLYKTGDLARWQADGNIEYLGRLDFQVKIRGHRIELGEIEYRLLKHKEIRETVVTVTQENRENTLCAYIVSDTDLTVTQLREYLAKDIPEQMIPAYFIKIDKIPLKPNGKVDRKALEGNNAKLATGTQYVEPGNETEEIIAKIWQEVLNLEKVSANDSFFEIGGNSLSLITVNSRLKKAIEKDIPLVYMFRYTTIRHMARYIDRGETGEDTPASKPQRVEAEKRGKDKLKNLKRKRREREV